METAAKIAVTEIQDFLMTYFQLQQIILVCRDVQTYQTYRQVVTELIDSLSLQPLSDESDITVLS